MKLIGSMLIIGAASLFGMRLAMDLDAKYEEMKYLKRLLYILQSEIRYSRSFLGEAFLTMSDNAKDPYASWLRQLYYRMEKRGEGAFSLIWTETIQQYLSGVKLPAAEKKRLSELGQYLGSADTQMQIKHIELFEEQLDTAMKDMQEELCTKKRLCRCLGVMGGIFLAILLI